MKIRPFQLPQDMELMNSLVMDGFQYPNNPEWSLQEDEKQGMIDRINSAKRLWPILRVLRIFSPIFQDILCGFIAEEENQPAGLINYMQCNCITRLSSSWHCTQTCGSDFRGTA